MTIPPNMTVDHELQAVLHWACQRGRQLAAAERAVARAETMRNGRLPEPEAETPIQTEAAPTEPSNVIGGGCTRAGKILWLLENRGPMTTKQLAAALNTAPANINATTIQMRKTWRIESNEPKGKWHKTWRLPEKAMP